MAHHQWPGRPSNAGMWTGISQNRQMLATHQQPTEPASRLVSVVRGGRVDDLVACGHSTRPYVVGQWANQYATRRADFGPKDRSGHQLPRSAT